jgi:hypothetical protein
MERPNAADFLDPIAYALAEQAWQVETRRIAIETTPLRPIPDRDAPHQNARRIAVRNANR